MLASLMIGLALWGLIALVAFLLFLFSPVGKCVRHMSIGRPAPSLGSDAFLFNAAVASGGEVTYFEDRTCEILSDNSTWFAALTKDVEQATRSIYISSYIWEADEVSEQFFKALAAAVGRGVSVHLLLDDFGNCLTSEKIERFRAEGIKVKRFRPFKFGKIGFYFSRNHRRSYIFDEAVAYIGGASVSQKWFLRHSRKHTFTSYIDIMYRFSGPAVRHAVVAFGELWTAASGEVLQFAAPELLLERESTQNAVFLNHSPRVDIHPYTYLLWYSCMVAKKKIIICSPYVVPGEAMAELLIQKARAGIEVTLITQGTGEIWFVAQAGHSYYEQFLKEGIHIYECKGPAHLHSKVTIIDDEWTIIGSANFDIRSQRINHETVVGVQSADFASRNTAVVEGYLKNAAEIDLKKWQRRPVLKKLLEQSLTFFSEQM